MESVSSLPFYRYPGINRVSGLLVQEDISRVLKKKNPRLYKLYKLSANAFKETPLIYCTSNSLNNLKRKNSLRSRVDIE